MERQSIHPSWLDAGRIPSLDGLRAIAVSLVVFDHVIESKLSREHHLAHEIAKALSDVGVDTFFVLSGFLITTMLCRERDRTKGISLRAFYTRRALRIFPAFVAYLLFVAFLGIAGGVQIGRGDWLAAVTYTMNFRSSPAWEVGHLWSLSIEEHFYLLWPPLLAMMDRRLATRLMVGLLVLEPVLRLLVLGLAPSEASIVELWTPVRTDGIAAGCLLALVSRDPRGLALLDRAAEKWHLAFLALVLALVGSFVSGKVDVGVTPTVVALSLAVLLWWALRLEPRWLTGRVITTIGLGSYSIYLWQQAFLSPHVGWWTSLPLSLVLVGVAAAFSYRFIEQPFVRIKDRKPAPGALTRLRPPL